MSDLLERMRGFESDHEPNGWPAVQMRDISALCDLAEQAEARVAALEEVARESQDWDWLAAKDCAEEQGQEFFEIPEMQELWESARNGDGKAYILRKQAEAVDEVNRKLTEISEGMDGRGMDPVLVMQYAASTAGEEAQRLRQQADEIEKVGGA